MEKPFTYTPFFRRFGNGRRRDFDEVRDLYALVKRAQDHYAPQQGTLGRPIFAYTHELPDTLGGVVGDVAIEIMSHEDCMRDLYPPKDGWTAHELSTYRDLLLARKRFFEDRDRVLALLYDTIIRTFGGITKELPETDQETPFTIPLIYALPNPRLRLEKTYMAFMDDHLTAAGLFRGLANRLIQNVCQVSGIDPADPSPKKAVKHAKESELPLDVMVKQYVGGTPLYDLFMAPVPMKLTREIRFNHTHIVGGTGAGKTTLIEHLLLHDIRGDDPPSLVVIDPHGDLINRLLKADLGIADRLVYVNPRDVEYPPALNVFAVNKERLNDYDAATREQVTAGVIQTFDYLFSGLFGSELTGKQSVPFRYMARLMLLFPEVRGENATILDMLHLTSDTTPYRDVIERLPPLARTFFEKDFKESTFKQTREQIRYRLQAILQNPTLERLFTARETKVDMFTELNKGSIILVDTAKDFLKDGSATFGRIFISLVLQAVLERAAIPEHRRKDTFLIVDECAQYFDSNIDDLLTEVRKYRCGCVFAHQYLDQASGSLKASLAANTGIKFASGLSAADASTMAREMRTTPEFILSQPKLQFAAHVKNVTPQAVSIPIPLRPKLPELSADAFYDLIEANREKVYAPPVAYAPSEVSVVPPSAPDAPGTSRRARKRAKVKAEKAETSPHAPSDTNDDYSYE